MQPEIVNVDGKNYRIFDDGNGVKYAAAPVRTFALRRVFNLEEGEYKTIDFVDLTGFWRVDSIIISSPDTSEITIEVLDSNNLVFIKDKLTRNQTPKSMPTALITPDLKMRFKAGRDDIDLVLVYLEAAHLAYSKDF